jgi:hypothetical protein
MGQGRPKNFGTLGFEGPLAATSKSSDFLRYSAQYKSLSREELEPGITETCVVSGTELQRTVLWSLQPSRKAGKQGSLVFLLQSISSLRKQRWETSMTTN